MIALQTCHLTVVEVLEVIAGGGAVEGLSKKEEKKELMDPDNSVVLVGGG